MHIAALVFIDIAIIMVVARLFGRLAMTVGQPPVVGEIIAGIALGPSLLGLLPGDLDDRAVPAGGPAVPEHPGPARAGAVHVHRRPRAGPAADPRPGASWPAPSRRPRSCCRSRSAPRWRCVLYPSHDETDAGPVAPLALALFLGVAMSITAFPVLARILTDRGMHRTTDRGARAGLRGGRRHHRLDPAGLRGRRRAGQRPAGRAADHRADRRVRRRSCSGWCGPRCGGSTTGTTGSAGSRRTSWPWSWSACWCPRTSPR